MSEILRKEAEKLATLPYMTEITLDETTKGERVYFARILELEGCFGQGKTPEEAAQNLNLAKIDFIIGLLEDKLPIPRPTTTSSTSNTFTRIYKGSKLESSKRYDAVLVAT